MTTRKQNSTNVTKNNNKKISWEYAEDFYCCWKYIEIFIDQKKKVSAKAVAEKIQAAVYNHNKTSIRDKLLNIKSIMQNKGVEDSLQETPLPHKSNNNIKAMDEVWKIYQKHQSLKKYKKQRTYIMLGVVLFVIILSVFVFSKLYM